MEITAASVYAEHFNIDVKPAMDAIVPVIEQQYPATKLTSAHLIAAGIGLIEIALQAVKNQAMQLEVIMDTSARLLATYCPQDLSAMLSVPEAANTDTKTDAAKTA